MMLSSLNYSLKLLNQDFNQMELVFTEAEKTKQCPQSISDS